MDFQDYAYLDDVVPGRASIRQSNGIARGNGHSNGVGEIENDDEDRQLVRFYAPQLEQHTDALTLAVDEFLATVENNLPPREFVQKGKLVGSLQIGKITADKDEGMKKRTTKANRF